MATFPPWMGGMGAAARPMAPRPLQAPGVGVGPATAPPGAAMGGMNPGLQAGLAAFRGWNQTPPMAPPRFGAAGSPTGEISQPTRGAMAQPMPEKQRQPAPVRGGGPAKAKRPAPKRNPSGGTTNQGDFFGSFGSGYGG